MENRKKSRIWDTSWILIPHSKFKFPGLQHLSRKLETVVQRFQYSHQWSAGLKCWISQKRSFWLGKSQNTYEYPLGGRKSSIVYAWLRVWFKTIFTIFTISVIFTLFKILIIFTIFTIVTIFIIFEIFIICVAIFAKSKRKYIEPRDFHVKKVISWNRYTSGINFSSDSTGYHRRLTRIALMSYFRMIFDWSVTLIKTHEHTWHTLGWFWAHTVVICVYATFLIQWWNWVSGQLDMSEYQNIIVRTRCDILPS